MGPDAEIILLEHALEAGKRIGNLYISDSPETQSFMRSLLLTLLIFGASHLTMAQDPFLTDAVAKWENMMAYTLELAEAMPFEHYDFRPTEEQMTFQEQVLHMAGNVAWLTGSYLHGEKVTVERTMENASKEEVIATARKALEAAHSALQNLDASTLDDEVNFFAGPMSRRRIVFLLNDHLTHHRGQIIVYARMQGIKPPSYRGW